jgi:hypothetical protein
MESPRYENLSKDELQKLTKKIDDSIRQFVGLLGYSDLKYQVSAASLFDMITRVDKRKAYYKYFHGMTINEYKEFALYAYWTIKLKPITITDERYRNLIELSDVNELFALCLIFTALYQMGRITEFLVQKNNYFEKLRYSFRYRNFTIDSFVVLVESINNQTFEQERDPR